MVNIKFYYLTSLLLILLIAPITPNSHSSINSNQYQPKSQLTNSTSKYSEEQTEEIWEFWTYQDLIGLDPWGDSSSTSQDIIAVYEKELDDSIIFRLDIMDFLTETITATHVVLDYKSGGNNQIVNGSDLVTSDIYWDLLISITGSSFALIDTSFTEISGLLSDTQIDHQLDFVAFTLSKEAFTGWDGSDFQIQALATNSAVTESRDKTDPVSTNDTTGRGKLVLTFMNFMAGDEPSYISWYDGVGYPHGFEERPGERWGMRYTLDAIEKYELPFTINDLYYGYLTSHEFLRTNDRIRSMSSRGLLDMLMTPGYSHYMTWQPDDVDAKAIEICTDLREGLNLPVSDVFYPYEGLITPGDIQVIKDAGLEAIYGIDQYRHWFGLLPDDDPSPPGAKAEIESVGKVHLINGMKFVFQTAMDNYGGYYCDVRWNGDCHNRWNEVLSLGTDDGLHYEWRRILLDLAIDTDQERYFTIGTDLNQFYWMFPDDIDRDFKWLASHPWIEVTTFSDIVSRGWEVIDHGTLGLEQDELLYQHHFPNDGHYNAYFSQSYYGGISDGHSPIVPAGVEIEGYYDYVPYLRDGILIPSGRIMGDDETPGSIVYETVNNLRSAPENDLTTLAYLSFMESIQDQIVHLSVLCPGGEACDGTWGGQYLDEAARTSGNQMRQVNKIVEAANWAQDVELGSVSALTQAQTKDIDLDGENEYILSNDKVFAIFENDGARLEYAFAYNNKHGPIQLIAPFNQVWHVNVYSDGNYEMGEVGHISKYRADGAFVEDLDDDNTIEYPVYNVVILGNDLKFTSLDGRIEKTFILEGNTIHAQYKYNSGTIHKPGFGITVNMMNMFNRDFSLNLRSVKDGDKLGWTCSKGGTVVLDPPPGAWVITDSFTDSPARYEMRARDDYDTYPPGHWYLYPYQSFGLPGDFSNREYTVSLLLSAEGRHFVDLPLIFR